MESLPPIYVEVAVQLEASSSSSRDSGVGLSLIIRRRSLRL